MDTSSAVEIGHVSSCVDEFYEMGWHGVAWGGEWSWTRCKTLSMIPKRRET